MNDQRMGPLLESWLKGTDAPPGDVGRSTALIESRLSSTPQRGRWWPLPLLQRLAGPSTGLMPTKGSTMFSALRFDVAAVIVALFGGFLLAGVLTTQQGDEIIPAAATDAPSPMATAESLSGMITEEVEPGVYRVINDGVRDLMPTDLTPNWMVVVSEDGSVWVLRDQGFIRLGGGSYEWQPGDGRADDFGVTPDGTIWASFSATRKGDDGIRAFDGTKWQTRKTAQAAGVEVGPDGTVWGWWERPKDGPRGDDPETVVARYGDDGWEHLQTAFGGPVGGLLVSGSGDIWLHSDDGVSKWADGQWQQQVGVPESAVFSGVGPDGTVWFAGSDVRTDESGEWVLGADEQPLIDPTLLAFDGSGWQVWGPEDGVPMSGPDVAPDGSVWMADLGPQDEESDCGGVLRFDGTSWDRYLDDRCAARIAIGPDGSVWAATRSWSQDEDDRYDLYVITPDAVAATE